MSNVQSNTGHRVRTDSKPWYKQFWPWFIIAIPASSVAAGMVMLHLAIDGADTLVRDDWYKDGMAINQRLDKQNRAREAGLKAFFSFDQEENIVKLRIDNLDAQQVPSLSLDLVHPTLAQRDIKVQLYRAPDNTYFAKLPRTPAGLYYAQIRSVEDAWEIDARINFGNVLSDAELN